MPIESKLQGAALTAHLRKRIKTLEAELSDREDENDTPMTERIAFIAEFIGETIPNVWQAVRYGVLILGSFVVLLKLSIWLLA